MPTSQTNENGIDPKIQYVQTPSRLSLDETMQPSRTLVVLAAVVASWALRSFEIFASGSFAHVSVRVLHYLQQNH